MQGRRRSRNPRTVASGSCPRVWWKTTSSRQQAWFRRRHFFFQVEVSAEEQGEPTLDGSPLEHGGEVILVPLDEALRRCSEGGWSDAKTELGLWRLGAELAGAEAP